MGSVGVQSSSSGTKESRLSNMQADILQQRQDQYNEYFFPEMLNALNDASGDTITNSLMTGNAAGINQQTNAAKRQLLINTGQRGISGSGAELSALANIENAKGSMLSDAYNKSKLAQIAQKNTVLQMGGAMSPTPTSSAQYHQQSESTGVQVGVTG